MLNHVLHFQGLFGSVKMKSAVGFDHVVESLHQHGAPEEVRSVFCRDLWEKGANTGIKSLSFFCWRLRIVGQKVITKSLMPALSYCFPYSSSILLCKYWNLVPNNNHIRVKEIKIWLPFKTWCSLSVPRCAAYHKENWDSWCLYSFTTTLLGPHNRVPQHWSGSTVIIYCRRRLFLSGLFVAACLKHNTKRSCFTLFIYFEVF